MISIMKSKELSFKTFKNSNLFIKIMPNNIKNYLLELLEHQDDKIRNELEDDLFKDELNLIADSMDYLNNI